MKNLIAALMLLTFVSTSNAFIIQIEIESPIDVECVDAGCQP